MTNDHVAHLDDERLGEAIRTLDVSWPPTPDVTRGVLRAIERTGPTRRHLSRTTVVLLIAAAILALAAAAAATKFALDLGGIAIESVPSPPSLPASPVDPGVLGQAVTPAHAQRALGSPLPIPPALGAPDRIWLDRETTSFEPAAQGTVVAMAWRTRPGLPRIAGTPYGATLFVFEGDDTVAVKLVGTRFTPVPGQEAFWIHGPHELDLLVDGRVHALRVTGTVLIWQNDGLAQRLETSLPKRDVLRIAFPTGT
jgi:hypothetical protein